MSELSTKNDELTDKQRKLVDTIVTTGCSITEAGIIAGYSTKKNNSYNNQKSNNTNRSTKNNNKRKL